MGSHLKPLAVPFAFAVLGFAMQLSEVKNPYLIGGLYGLAIVLLLFALLNHRPLTRAIHRRWPWLIEWLPLLVRNEQYLFASPEEIAGPYVRGRVFRLTDIAMYGLIKSRTFEECVIVGPAVISGAPNGGTVSVVGCTVQIRNRLEGCIYDLGPGKLHVMEGTIYADDCVFRRCEFIRITFAVPHDQVDGIRSQMTVQQVTPQPSPASPPASSVPASPRASAQE